MQVDVHDPWADADEARREYGLELVSVPSADSYDGVVVAVAHAQFREAGAAALRAYSRDGAVLCDLKSVFAGDESDLRL
jgi:UDP-N-acetyl-D-galactosamine dehydrogenase